MGLNAKEIPPRLGKMLHASYNASYTFVQRHPVVSGVFSFFLILYIFLSYIYSFLVYLSPFILCTAIFIRIFWSSEQPQLRYVKREKKRSESKHTRASSKSRNDFVLDRYYNYPSQCSSRRRHFRDKKWDLQGDNNEFSHAASELNKVSKEISSAESSRRNSSDHVRPTAKLVKPDRQTLRSEPSMSDLVCYGLGESKNLEDIRDDEGEESQDDRIKAVEWTETDHKSRMEIEYSELERNTRMETLIANRKARKLLKMQIDRGVNPSHLPPVYVTRNKNFEEFVGIEMPDSAPSVIRPSRKPFDHRYDPSEEGKPSTHQAFTEGLQKDKTFSRIASFSVGRFQPSPDKGNHDWLIEQMFSKGRHFFDSDESGVTFPTTPQSNSKETDMGNMKEKEVENAHLEKSFSAVINSNNGLTGNDQNISSVQGAGVSEKQESRVQKKPPEKLLSFSRSNSTNINESLFNSLTSPIDEKHQDFYSGRRICKTPTCSIASDLQVEVSEVGSPTLTHEGSNSSSDEESSLYDGDNEKDITSGSEDMWGNSIHARDVVGGVSDSEDIAEANLNKDIPSTFPIHEIDEENTADVSSVSSTCDIPGDTPTYAVNDGYNIFCNLRDDAMQNETAQPSNSLDVPSSRSHSEKPEGWCNLNENYKNEAKDVKDVNESATIDLSPTVQSHNGDLSNPQTNCVDEDKSEIEVEKDVQDNSAVSAEKEVSNLTKPAAAINSVNTPAGEKVTSNKDKEVESQTSEKPESTAEPFINTKTEESRATNNSEGTQGDLKEGEAIVSSKSARESDKLSETAGSEVAITRSAENSEDKSDKVNEREATTEGEVTKPGEPNDDSSELVIGNMEEDKTSKQ